MAKIEIKIESFSYLLKEALLSFQQSPKAFINSYVSLGDRLSGE
jgi:hypothetical protein